jgi:hypothetical protein
VMRKSEWKRRARLVLGGSSKREGCGCEIERVLNCILTRGWSGTAQCGAQGLAEGRSEHGQEEGTKGGGCASQ